MTGGTVIGREGRRLGLSAAAGLVALLAGLAFADPARAGDGFSLVDIGNFNSPVHVDDAPGADGLLFVVEQGGTIRVLDDEDEAGKPFLNIRDIVRSAADPEGGGEEGLLSVAFHPNYDSNRRFYVYFTNNHGDIRIDQFKRRASQRKRASRNSRTKVIKIDHDQASNHNGGQLQFGPDGFLYASVGDGGPQQDPENDAQEPGSLLGKLLRIDPRGGGGYDVPADNPYVGMAGADEIFALGLRNPWRFSFDSETGALTLGDVGGTAFEEVDYVAGGGLGANFGWNDYEGLTETPFGIGPNATPHTAPIAAFESVHTGGDFCAIAGGYVVRDPGLSELTGQYVFSDVCANEVRAIQVPSGADGTVLGVSGSSIVSFGEGEGGQIYVVDLAGDVFRLEQPL
jgi:glucose/arabinose dehydrogenase